MTHKKAHLSNFREKIAGIEVVDAAFADRLLRATIRVLETHRAWRLSTWAYEADRSKANRNKKNGRRKSYRSARAVAWAIVDEATSKTPNTM